MISRLFISILTEFITFLFQNCKILEELKEC